MYRTARRAFRGVCLALATVGCSAAPTQPAPIAAPPPTVAPKTENAPAPADKPRPFVIVDDPKQPTARTPDGCVVLEVEKQWHNLKYRRGASPQCPTFAAALPLLHEMLLALAATGDLAEITSLDVSGEYAAYYERLTLAAARSPAWNTQSGKPTQGDPNAFVIATTRDATAFFPEIVTLLAGTGLSAAWPSVEKVLVGRAAETPFATQLSAAGVATDAKLPFDCMLYFHLEKP